MTELDSLKDQVRVLSNRVNLLQQNGNKSIIYSSKIDNTFLSESDSNTNSTLILHLILDKIQTLIMILGLIFMVLIGILTTLTIIAYGKL